MGIFKQEVQQIVTLFCLKWWLTECYDVITDEILTGSYQAQQYRRCNLTSTLHSHSLPLFLELQLRNYSLTLDYHSLFCAKMLHNTSLRAGQSRKSPNKGKSSSSAFLSSIRSPTIAHLPLVKVTS